MVTKTAMFIWFCLSWTFLTVFYMIVSGALGFIVGLLAGGVLGFILALLVKLFSLGRFPRTIGSAVMAGAIIFAVIGAIVFAIAGCFEFLPDHLPR